MHCADSHANLRILKVVKWALLPNVYVQMCTMARTVPVRVPKLQQRKVTHKVPGDIDI